MNALPQDNMYWSLFLSLKKIIKMQAQAEAVLKPQEHNIDALKELPINEVTSRKFMKVKKVFNTLV